MDPKIDLKTILKLHLKFRRGEDDGTCANLSRANLGNLIRGSKK